MARIELRMIAVAKLHQRPKNGAQKAAFKPRRSIARSNQRRL